jgi:myo-inositol 2-dehydrogenase / D-chiro-inositol 1-dehydrogenase
MLRERGYRNIAFLGGPQGATSTEDRLRGLRESLRLAGLDTCAVIYGHSYCHEAGYTLMKQLLRNGGVDAVFCGDDVLAMGAIDACRDAGVDVPGQLGVIGFNNMAMAAWPAYNLTTIHQPVADIIVTAVELLLGVVDQSEQTTDMRLFDCKAIERGRCDPAEEDGMVNIALFGAGRIGVLHAANIAASHPRATLGCVYDTNRSAAEALASKHGTRVAPSVDAALASKDIDAVMIASSTSTHVELIIAAARAGKAILCEKPIDLDIERVERCRRDIAGSGVPVQIAFNRRYDRNHRAVRDAVRAGDIGALELLVLTSRDPGLPSLDYIRSSGGIFRDMTIHDFDLARFILGEDAVVEVYATGSVMVEPQFQEIGDVDTAMVVMKAASGALVHINNSRRAVYGYDQRVEAFGSKGMVQSDNLRNTSLVRSDARTTDAREPLLNFFMERYRQAYVDELNEFIDVITGKAQPTAGFEDGRCALLLANAAWESLRSGRSVQVSYT